MIRSGFLFLLFSVELLCAQSPQEDSVNTLLCKKWVPSYAMIDNMKIGKMPGVTDIVYDFKRDKTFLLKTDEKSKNIVKGTWVYDPNKKLIVLNVNGKERGLIISLKSKEMIILNEIKENSNSEVTKLKLVCNPKE